MQSMRANAFEQGFDLKYLNNYTNTEVNMRHRIGLCQVISL